MKTKLMVMTLLAGATMFAAPRVSVGFGMGSYSPRNSAPAYAAQRAIPPCPGPDYVWMNGNWERQRNYSGHAVAPRYTQPRESNRFDNRQSASKDMNDHRDQDRYNDRGRGVEQGRQGNSFGNSFRSR